MYALPLQHAPCLSFTEYGSCTTATKPVLVIQTVIEFDVRHDAISFPSKLVHLSGSTSVRMSGSDVKRIQYINSA